MEKVSLQTTKRQETGKEHMKKMRKAGFIPAIVYGEGAPIPIKLPHEMLRVMRSIHFSQNTIITMNISDNTSPGEEISVFIKDVQTHPLTEEVIHLDFLKVSLDETVRVNVPLILKGIPKSVKEGEGILEQMMREIFIEAFPLQVPEKIELDVSGLEIGNSLHIRDIKVADNVKIIDSLDDTVVTIVAQHEEVQEETPTEPEVVSENKENAKEKETKS